MADYTPPPWSQLVAGKAWTDEKAAASFENPIAIAEGSPGAPRLQPKARASALLGTATGAGTTPAGVSDLAGYRKLIIYIASENGSGSAGYMQMAGSADNGVTWGSSVTGPGFANTSTLHVDLDTGAVLMMDGLTVIASLPPGCNALRWGRSAGDGGFRAMVFADEGRDDV